MRELSIYIAARIGSSDNEYSFNATIVPNNNEIQLDNVYAFASLNLNYSITTSNVTSTLLLTMSQPVSGDNIFRSGQYVTVTDNGTKVFEGVILTVNYELLPIEEGGTGNMLCILTLAPSIYQLTIMPMVFDSNQAQQMSQLLNVNVPAILLADVTQKSKTDAYLSYIVQNTDYNNFFGKTIQANDLGDNLFVIADINESKDTVLRKSIEYWNAVMYQQEDGEIVIRQLDYSLEAPFDIDIQNQYNIQPEDNTNTIPTVPLLAFTYSDNAYSTPAIISNYAIVGVNEGAGAQANALVLSYAPNPQIFTRLSTLLKSGWLVGSVGQTQLNNNIISDPTTAQALSTFYSYPEAFIVNSKASGINTPQIAGYQALLTAKETAQAIAGFASFSGTISLDDKKVPANLGNVIGSIIQIQGLPDLPNGIIAAATRNYSLAGSFLSFTVAPPGSFTAYWKNSTAQAQFS